jgi:hypothetical protein
MGIGEPSGSLCICALTTAGRRLSGAVSRADLLGRPVLLAALALEPIPATTDRDRFEATTASDRLPQQTRGESTDLHREHPHAHRSPRE